MSSENTKIFKPFGASILSNKGIYSLDISFESLTFTLFLGKSDGALLPLIIKSLKELGVDLEQQAKELSDKDKKEMLNVINDSKQ